MDIDTGVIEKVRGRLRIGDALAPTVAMAFILVGGILLIISERKATDQPTIKVEQLKFIIPALAILIISFLIMRYAGPLAVEVSNLFRSEPAEYRLLRASVPWKHLGFVLGGMTMITGVISLVEQRFTRRALLTSIIAVVVLILIFDLPFDDLLLPPNGDV
jgi:uncharacterized protein YacL